MTSRSKLKNLVKEKMKLTYYAFYFKKNTFYKKAK